MNEMDLFAVYALKCGTRTKRGVNFSDPTGNPLKLT